MPETINNSKLIQLLLSFSRKEKKLFRDFLDSPYYNKREDVRMLYGFLEGQKNWEKPISREEIARWYAEKQAGGEHMGEESRLRNIMSTMTGLVETFLVLQANEKRQLDNHRLLIDELMVRKLYTHARSILKKSRKKLAEFPYQNRAFLYHQFRLEESTFYLNIIEENRSLDNDAEQVIQNFRKLYFANVLMYCCAAINQTRILNINYDLPFLPSFVKAIEKELSHLPPLVKIYYNILMFLKEKKGHSYFAATKKLVIEHQQILDDTNLRQVCNFMVNFCSFEVQKGKRQYLEEQFNIYNEFIPSGIWNSGLYFSPHHFNYYIICAIQINKIEAAKEFISQYNGQLSPNNKDDLTNLSHARIYFAKGDFERSLSYLNLYRGKEDFFYKLYHKTLLVKLLYETKAEESLIYALESLRVYLNPKRSPSIGEDFRKTYLEFRRLMFHLSACRFEPNSKGKIPKIQQEIKTAVHLVEREWLLQKVDLLT